jgi:uncharacterized protein with ParB-like and HNH nuclease domain
LLGSIVCLTGHHTAVINRLELVDGQQRLTTVAILLECVRELLALNNEPDQAQEVGRLLTSKALGGQPLAKIAFDSIDGQEYRSLIISNPEIDATEFRNQHLFAAFQIIREWLSEKDAPHLIAFLYKLQNQALVIRLDVSDAKDAFKLFETINNRDLNLAQLTSSKILFWVTRLGSAPISLRKRVAPGHY